jgi:hypothetical protein
VRRGGFEGSILAFGHERENMVLHNFSFESEAKQSRPECVLPALGNNCKRVLAQQRYAKSGIREQRSKMRSSAFCSKSGVQ